MGYDHIICLLFAGVLLCCERVRIAAAAMAANVDERHGRALLTHASHMREVLRRERKMQAMQQQQQQQQQARGSTCLHQMGCAAQAPQVPATVDALQGLQRSRSLGAFHQDLNSELTWGSPPPLVSPAVIPSSFPACVEGPLGGQPDIALLMGACSYVFLLCCVSNCVRISAYKGMWPQCATTCKALRGNAKGAQTSASPIQGHLLCLAVLALPKFTSVMSASHGCVWLSVLPLRAGEAATPPPGCVGSPSCSHKRHHQRFLHQVRKGLEF
jgi:hypothetical protein